MFQNISELNAVKPRFVRAVHPYSEKRDPTNTLRTSYPQLTHLAMRI